MGKKTRTRRTKWRRLSLGKFTIFSSPFSCRVQRPFQESSRGVVPKRNFFSLSLSSSSSRPDPNSRCLLTRQIYSSSWSSSVFFLLLIYSLELIKTERDFHLSCAAWNRSCPCAARLREGGKRDEEGAF